MKKTQWVLLFVMLFVLAVGGCGGGGGGNDSETILPVNPDTPTTNFSALSGEWTAHGGSGIASGYGDSFRVLLRDGGQGEFELLETSDSEAIFKALMTTYWDVYDNSQLITTMPLGTDGITQAIIKRTGNNSFQYVSGIGSKLDITFVTETSVRIDIDGVYQITWSSGKVDQYKLKATYYMDKVATSAPETPNPVVPEPVTPAPDPYPDPVDPEPTPDPVEPDPTPDVVPVDPVIPPTEEVILYQGQVAGTFNGWSEDTLIEVDNGNIWKQATYYYHYTYAYRPNITIYLDGTRYYAEVEGIDKRVEVEMVMEYFKGKIKDTFNGWNGDTVIELIDGSLWEQDDNQIEVAFAFQPDIIIYRHDYETSFYASVEGVDKHVKVNQFILGSSPEPVVPSPDPVTPVNPVIPPIIVDGIVYQGTIADAFYGWTGNTLVELSNGTLWKQVVYYYEYEYAYRPDITIYKEGTRYYAEVEGIDRRVEVTQVDYIKSSIKGTFNGWDGDTIIELRNGTTWEQDDYQRENHRASNPDVIIYKDGISFYAVVEDVDKHVKVKQIN
jgi:hypothetical protein